MTIHIARTTTVIITAKICLKASHNTSKRLPSETLQITNAPFKVNFPSLHCVCQVPSAITGIPKRRLIAWYLSGEHTLLTCGKFVSVTCTGTLSIIRPTQMIPFLRPAHAQIPWNFVFVELLVHLICKYFSSLAINMEGKTEALQLMECPGDSILKKLRLTG